MALSWPLLSDPLKDHRRTNYLKLTMSQIYLPWTLTGRVAKRGVGGDVIVANEWPPTNDAGDRQHHSWIFGGTGATLAALLEENTERFPLANPGVIKKIKALKNRYFSITSSGQRNRNSPSEIIYKPVDGRAADIAITVEPWNRFQSWSNFHAK